ncbi:hypothetical protein SAMN04487996_10429 [Dyadobacter soli]|uniref:Uncharacterized protein n=1 Tax=Dyadobacter soli TaxID=659014 RepID=A0A1G7B067_9BACT|nr:hypothetical protein [Dyadobacter soli]SDE20342.1 hypothetical protein SAMN04487996_10429 [Dyadobacter soli]
MSFTVYTRDDDDLIEITLSSVPFTGSAKKAYWGWMSTPDMLVEAQIVVLQGSAEFAAGAKVVADFRSGNSQPMFLYMAERDTEPLKTVWYATSDDNGQIGPDQVFSVIGVVNGWRVYRSKSKTYFSTTTEFRIS